MLVHARCIAVVQRCDGRLARLENGSQVHAIICFYFSIFFWSGQQKHLPPFNELKPVLAPTNHFRFPALSVHYVRDPQRILTTQTMLFSTSSKLSLC